MARTVRQELSKRYFNPFLVTVASAFVAGVLAGSARLLNLSPQPEITLISGELFARRWQTPAAVFTVPGVIPLVPGSFAFHALIGLIQITDLGTFGGTPVLVEAAVNAVRTGLILAAIAAGTAAPSLLFQRHKPVV